VGVPILEKASMEDAVRGLLITGDLSDLLINIAAIAVFDIVLFNLASMSFKRIIE
jgi:ABC-2 type transport system permease protein